MITLDDARSNVAVALRETYDTRHRERIANCIVKISKSAGRYFTYNPSDSLLEHIYVDLIHELEQNGFRLNSYWNSKYDWSIGVTW
jgi:hypothetical protein